MGTVWSPMLSLEKLPELTRPSWPWDKKRPIFCQHNRQHLGEPFPDSNSPGNLKEDQIRWLTDDRGALCSAQLIYLFVCQTSTSILIYGEARPGGEYALFGSCKTQVSLSSTIIIVFFYSFAFWKRVQFGQEMRHRCRAHPLRRPWGSESIFSVPLLPEQMWRVWPVQLLGQHCTSCQLIVLRWRWMSDGGVGDG